MDSAEAVEESEPDCQRINDMPGAEDERNELAGEAGLDSAGRRWQQRVSAPARRSLARERMIEFEPNDGPSGYGSLMEKKRARGNRNGGAGAVPR